MRKKGQGLPSGERKPILPGILLLLLLLVAAFPLLWPAEDRESEQLQLALLSGANGLRRGARIALTEGPEGPLVQAGYRENGTDCIAAYYLYRGQFYEQLYTGDRPFDPLLGSALCPASEFDAKLEDGLLSIALTGPGGSREGLSLFFPTEGREDRG